MLLQCFQKPGENLPVQAKNEKNFKWDFIIHVQPFILQDLAISVSSEDNFTIEFLEGENLAKGNLRDPSRVREL